MEQLIEFAGNHAMLVAAFVAVLLLLVWTEIGRRTRGYTELTPALAVQKINRGDTTVIDISNSADFAKGHLCGSKHIALSRFSKPDPDIEKAKEGPVLVVCKNGQTAHQAAQSPRAVEPLGEVVGGPETHRLDRLLLLNPDIEVEAGALDRLHRSLIVERFAPQPAAVGRDAVPVAAEEG